MYLLDVAVALAAVQLSDGRVPPIQKDKETIQ
jgi:hypothetical protein